MRLPPIGVSVAAGASLLSVICVGYVHAQNATPDQSTTTPAPSATPDQSTTTPAPSATPDQSTTTPAPSATPDQSTTTPAPSATPDQSTTTPAPSATPDQGTTTPAPSATPYQVTAPGTSAAPTPGTSLGQNASPVMPPAYQGLTPVNGTAGPQAGTPGIAPTPNQQMMTIEGTTPAVQMQMNEADRFGGPIYNGTPSLDITASFVAAGGGPFDFSINQALGTLGGRQFADDEIMNLRNQFGVKAIAQWEDVFNFAILDSYLLAQKQGWTLPLPERLGPAFGLDVVNTGVTPDNDFRIGYLLDKTTGHDIHDRVMDDIDSKYGNDADTNFHQISNQAMVDLGNMLGEKGILVPQMQQ